MNSVMVEIPFAVNPNDGKITFPSLNLLKIAEALAQQKVLQCNCGVYFVRRGNQKSCDICRGKNL